MRAVLGLGRGLGLPVLAEGVENSNELAFLAQEQCDEVHGYHVGRPLPIEEFAHLTNPVFSDPSVTRLHPRKTEHRPLQDSALELTNRLA